MGTVRLAGRWARPAVAPDTRARRDRIALGGAIRGISAAPDLMAAAALITERAAWLVRADAAALMRIEGDIARVAHAHGSVGSAGWGVAVVGALAEAVRTRSPASVRAAGRADVAAPVEVGGRPWGALVLSGPAGRIPGDAAERVAPFADLLSLAATTFEDRNRLASLAGTDPLTGLGNRRTFDALLSAEVERARRGGEPLSLILLDIDHFKSVNDRFGHQLGDRVLAEVGRRLVAIARGGEAVTRIGGEEFAWILPRTSGEEAENAASRALRAVGGMPFEEIGTLTMSAGVSDLGRGAGAQDVVRHADLMLYRAKADGRNTFRRATAGVAPAPVP